MYKKLYKSRTDVKIAGVCAGIGNFFGIDSTLIRVAWIIFMLVGGSGFLAYIICAFIMPVEPVFIDKTVDLGKKDEYNRYN